MLTMPRDIDRVVDAWGRRRRTHSRRWRLVETLDANTAISFGIKAALRATPPAVELANDCQHNATSECHPR